jgi:hypothetical protein
MAPNFNPFANNPYLNQQPQPQTNIFWVEGLEGAKKASRGTRVFHGSLGYPRSKDLY